MRRQTAGWLVAAVATAAIASVTLLPISQSQPQVWERCVVCGERGVADGLVNVLLYVPLGLGLALAGLRARQSVLGGALLSGTIELAQMLVPGRDPSPGDVLFNTTGVAVGLAIVAVAPRVGRLTDRAATRWSLAAGLLVPGVIGATGWLLQPQWPATTYFGQWTADLTYLEWYRGTVLSAKVGDVLVRSRQIDQQELVRGLLAVGAPIRVDAVAGPAPSRLAPLFSIYDHRRIEILLVGPDRETLVYRYRTRGTALRLDQPDLRAPGALNGVRSGDTLLVEVTRDPEHRGAVCLAVNRDQRCGLGFDGTRGWSVLYSVESFPPWVQALLDLAWSALLLIPLGLVARRRWETLLAVAVAVAGLALVPAAVGLLPTGARGYLGGLLGMVWGSLGAGRLRRG